MTRKLITVIIIVVAVLVTAVGGAAIAGIIIYNNQPENVAFNSVVGLFESVSEREEFASVIDAQNGGSISVDAKKAYLIRGMERQDISGKLYFSDKGIAVQDFKFETFDAGDEYDVKLSGELYLSEDFIYAKSTELLGGAYGAELDQLIEEFKNSIFAYGSGSEYAIEDEEEYNRFISELEKYLKSDFENKKMRRDAEKIVKEYVKKAWSIFTENAEIVEGETDTLFDGSTGEYRLITIKVNEEAILNTIEEIYQFVKEDDSVREFLVKYEDELSIYIEKEDETRTLAQEYDYAVAEFGSRREDFKEDLINGRVFKEVIFELTTRKNKSELLQFNYSYYTYTSFSPTTFTLCFGDAGLIETDKIMLDSTALGGTLQFEVIENSDEYYKASLKYSFLNTQHISGTTKEDVEMFSLEIDRTKKLYTLKLGGEKGYTKISGECRKDGDTLSLSATTIIKNRLGAYRYEDYEIPTKIYLVFVKGDEMPQKPTDYTSVSEITDADVDGWVEFFRKIEEEYGLDR